MKRIAIAVSLLLTGALIGGAVGYARWHDRGDPFSFRRWVTINRTDDFPRGGLLLLGNSTVERLYIPEICGLPAFNAGLSSARSDQLAPMVPDLIKRLRPSQVVVAVGANDIEQGRAEWPGTVEQLTPRGAIVVGITGQPDANAKLAAIARRKGGVFVEPIPAIMTTDGVHVDARGSRLWKDRVNAACAQRDRAGGRAPAA